jgi:AraC family L-rhamnose operon regulatory protein RhaS
MNEIEGAGVPTMFEDHGATYYADACVPLERAAAVGEVELRALARGHYPGERFPDGAVPEIRTIGYWDAQSAQSWGLDWHRNEGIEITFLAHGNLDFAVAQNNWKLHAGHVTVTRPWQEHRVGAPFIGASNLHWLILDVGVRRPNQTWQWPEWVGLAPEDLARLTTLLQHNEYAVWQGNAALAEMFEHAASLVRDPSRSTFRSEMRLAVSGILLELLKSLESSDVELDDSLTAPRRGVSMFLHDLEAHLDHPWTVTTMAHACGMGRTQFTQHCQDLTNASPIEFLNTRRITRAAQLLLETTMLVTEIARVCGFDTPQYFATRFKREFGATPTEYRMSQR